jgi:hypothetical protein
VAGLIVLASLLLMALMTPSQSKRTDRFARFLYKRVPLFSSYGQALFVVKIGSWVFAGALLFFDWGSPTKFWFFFIAFILTLLRFVFLLHDDMFPYM